MSSANEPLVSICEDEEIYGIHCTGVFLQLFTCQMEPNCDGETVISADLHSTWVDMNCSCKHQGLGLQRSFTSVFAYFLIDSFSVLLFANTPVDFDMANGKWTVLI